MDITSRFADRIAEERLLWEELSKRKLKGAIFPDMLAAAGIMAKIIDAMRSKPFQGLYLRAFLESARRLRGVLPGTILQIETVLEQSLHRWKIKGSIDHRHLIASSMELRERAREFLNAITQVQNQADGLRSREESNWVALVGFILRTREDNERILKNNDTILEGMTRDIDRAATSFEAGASNAARECISCIIGLQQRKAQFQRAEQSAQLLERIVLGPGIYHGTEEQRVLEEAPSMQEAIATDVKQWLSGSKRIYFLTGEAGTGKSHNARGLCRYLYFDRLSTARLGGSFFLAPEDKDLASLRLAILSLAYQVAPQPRSIIMDDIRGYLHSEEEKTLQDAVFGLLCKSLSAASDREPPTVLVLDGIDQCAGSNEIPSLLRRLLAVVRAFSWLFLFLAARPRPNIMSVLTHPSVADLVHHGQLDNDVGTWNRSPNQHLMHMVPKIATYTDYFQSHPDGLQRLVELANCDNRFLQLAMRYLGTGRDRPEVRMNHVLSMAASKSPLEVLYLEQLQSATSLLLPHQHKHFQTLMRFIAYTERGLSPDTMSFYAHEAPSDAIVHMVDDLRAILTINHDCEIVPHDVSFPRFLRNIMRQERPDLPLWLQGNEFSHAASICLAALSKASTGIAILPRLLPPPDLLPNYCDSRPIIPFLSIWPWYLSKSKSMAHPELTIQLSLFVPSVSLAMYAWVTEPADIHRTAAIVAEYVVMPLVDTGPENAYRLAEELLSSRKRIIFEFYAFVCYVQLRRDRAGQPIFATDIIEAIAEGGQDVIVSRNTGLYFAADLTSPFSCSAKPYNGHVSIEPAAIRRYHNITEDFLAQLYTDEHTGDEYVDIHVL